MEVWLKDEFYLDESLPDFEHTDQTYHILTDFKCKYGELKVWIHEKQPKLLETLQGQFSISEPSTVSVLEMIYEGTLSKDARLQEYFLYLVEIAESLKITHFSKAGMISKIVQLSCKYREKQAQLLSLKNTLLFLYQLYEDYESLLNEQQKNAKKHSELKQLSEVLARSDHYNTSVEILKAKQQEYLQRIHQLELKNESVLESFGLLVKSRKDGRVIQRKEQEISKLTVDYVQEEMDRVQSMFEQYENMKNYLESLRDFPMVRICW